ncbi:MAG: hypothetical protein PVG07_03500, partial [Acidobacteriota bacterium]
MMLRLGVTVVCLALYIAGLWLPLPLVDTSIFPDWSSTSWSPRLAIGALGFAPFITGFLIVEIFSLLTPQGRRLRRDGIRGRRRLNLGALAVSSLVAVTQAVGIALWLDALSVPGGGKLTSGPTWILALTIATAAFAVAGLAGLISRYGLGNGFAVLFGGSVLLEAVRAIAALVSDDLVREPETRLMSLIWIALLAALVVAFMRRRPTVPLATPDGGSLPYRLPPLPQGLAPVSWAYAVLELPTLPLPMGREPLVELSYTAYHAVLAVLILVLSALGGWMFTARRRVEANLEGVASVPAASFDRAWRHQLVVSTLLLVAGEAGLALAAGVVPDVDVALITVATLIPLVAVTLDLVETARLARKTPLERVITLDNVHLAEVLRARLRQEEIDCVVSSLR